jgi:hypothetical protein
MKHLLVQHELTFCIPADNWEIDRHKLGYRSFLFENQQLLTLLRVK